MGKEEDWKELNQWQEQQEQKQKEDLDRRRYPIQGLKEQQKAEGKTDTITKLAKLFHLSEDAREILIKYKDEIKLSIVVVIGCIFMIFWNIATVPDSDRLVKNRYGKEFKRISVVEREDKSKLYTYQSKKYPDLQFYVEITRTKDVRNDAAQRRLKYFYEKADLSLKEKFVVETEEENGIIKFYKLAYIFDGMEEVEEAVDTVYKLREVLKKDMLESELGAYTRVYARSTSGVYLTLFYNPRFTLEEEKEDAKRQYVSGVIEHINRGEGNTQLIAELEEFTPEMLSKYMQTDLKICLNGKPLIENARGGSRNAIAYHREDGYYFSLTKEFLEAIPGTTIQQTGDAYLTFYFDGKRYVNDHLYSEKEVRDVFGATFEYDYKNLTVNIVIK